MASSWVGAWSVIASTSAHSVARRVARPASPVRRLLAAGPARGARPRHERHSERSARLRRRTCPLPRQVRPRSRAATPHDGRTDRSPTWRAGSRGREPAILVPAPRGRLHGPVPSRTAGRRPVAGPIPAMPRGHVESNRIARCPVAGRRSHPACGVPGPPGARRVPIPASLCRRGLPGSVPHLLEGSCPCLHISIPRPRNASAASRGWPSRSLASLSWRAPACRRSPSPPRPTRPPPAGASPAGRRARRPRPERVPAPSASDAPAASPSPSPEPSASAVARSVRTGVA